MPFFILAGLLVVWRGGFRARAMLACLLVSIAIMEGGIINPLKKTLGRHRPIDTLAEARYVKLGPAEPAIRSIRPTWANPCPPATRRTCFASPPS